LIEFNVLTEPWIPIRKLSGQIEEVGILKVLEEAHSYKDICAESVLENYAVTRLLIAFLSDAYTPRRVADRRKILKEGRFSREIIEGYVNQCLSKGASFNLFDKDRPFMQSSYDASIDEGKEKPIAALQHHVPSGNNHTHFLHMNTASYSITYAQALRSLCAAYVFCVAGLAGPSSVNNTPCVYYIVEGANLFETLVYSMVSKAELGNIPWNEPPIAWLDQPYVKPKQEIAAMSFVSAYTWMPRRVTLIPNGNTGLIDKVYLTAGRNFLGNGLWRDPHVAYRSNKKEEYYPVKPAADRDLWRDIATLTASDQEKSHIPPLIVSQIALLLDESSIMQNVKMVGLITDQASYLSVVSDELALPLPILSNPFLGSTLKRDLRFLEDVANILRKSFGELEASLGQEISSSFLGSMHEWLFRYYIPNLSGLQVESATERSVLRKAVHEVVRYSTSSIYHEQAARFGVGAKNLIQVEKSIIQCRRQIGKWIKKREEGNDSGV